LETNGFFIVIKEELPYFFFYGKCVCPTFASLNLNPRIMTRLFKIIATLEGISLLALLLIAMPLKYMYNMPEYVRVVGMAHGLLFIVYIIIASMLKAELKWPLGKYFLICIASVIPFGTFYIEYKYFRNTENENSENI